MVSNSAEPRNILAEPLGSAKPRLGITGLVVKADSSQSRGHRLNPGIEYFYIFLKNYFRKIDPACLFLVKHPTSRRTLDTRWYIRPQSPKNEKGPKNRKVFPAHKNDSARKIPIIKIVKIC